jgi:predicted permease
LGQNRSWGIPIPAGRTFAPGEIPTGPLVYVTTPGYQRAMGTRLHGRDFTWSDCPTCENVVIINEAYARFFWPGEDAVGKILVSGKQDLHIIGVVADVHEENTEGAPGWQIYYPIMQADPSAAQLVVRTTMKPAALAASVLLALRELNPKQPAAEFKPVQMLVDHANSPRRFFMLLVAAFAALGLLLAALGIYGVISYSVTRQTQEIGIRMALGAGPDDVRRMVVMQGMWLAFIGVFLGVAASLALTRLIANLLYGVKPWDPISVVSVAALLIAIALFATYIPARRASRVDPIVSLRYE